MDGERMVPVEGLLRDRTDIGRATTRKPKTFRWLVIVGLVLAIVLGGLYGFNRFREHAIATYFANNKPPPAQISAAEVKTEAVPQFANGIGSVTAVHQVTINPEVGGRVTKIFFEPGATVKAGDPLVQLNDGPERGDLASYEAQARWAQTTLERSSQLAQRQFEARETVDQKQSQLDQARAMIIKTEALIAQKLIRAPFSGRLGTRQIEVGQYLNPGAPIVTLTDLSTLYVNFTLPSQLRAQISVGQRVNVTADAFPGHTFEAEITTIEPQISANTRTMTIQATMPNPDNALLPGMFVNAAVVLPPQPDVMVLPETAVDYTLYGDSVYVIRQDGKDANGRAILKAVRTPVKTGARLAGKVAILEGLKPGERVIAAGQVKVQNGAPVAISDEPAPQPPAELTRH
ncbi:MAG: efflux RND transporter periplasmic adaptor subunit [Alphaproteobacteria bacterium]|nr:efflux RND transporter periplasmic adaptor subunit [Alphaproteobacteria bacterium]MBV9374952.1 efflux RND transporter periplasmic adaptor subunit [Alphaproteobacteria bacterium]